MPDEKKEKIHFTLLGAKRRDEDFVVFESTSSSQFSLEDARQQISKIDGIPSCFSFLKERNVVQSEDETSISTVDCLTENRLLVLVINFSAVQRSLAESAREIILRNKNSGSSGEERLKVVDATVNCLKLMSKIARGLGKVFKNFLEEEGDEASAEEEEEEEEGEQATDVIEGAARVLSTVLKIAAPGVVSCAPPVGIALAAMVPVLTAIGNSIKVGVDTIKLFKRLETLLSYLDHVMVYVAVKGGPSPEGDETFCMIMTLIDQSFEEIMTVHKERHGFGGRIKRLWRSGGHLKKLSELDGKITRILIETTALNSMKLLLGFSVDVEKIDRRLLILNEKLDDYVKNGETTREEIQAIKDQMGTLVDLAEKGIGIGTNILSIVTNIQSNVQSMFQKMCTDPNYPTQNKITTDDQNSGQLRPQSDQSIQEGLQIDLVLRAAIFLNMIFLTLASKFFQIEDNERYSFGRDMTGKTLSAYLKKELRLHFRQERQGTLFDASCTFLEGLGDDVILYDIDRSKDCSFGIFINKAAKRITIVFRPMIIAPDVEKQSELKISTLGMFPEAIDLSRFSDLKDKNIGKVCLHGGYYEVARCKYDQIKVMLYNLNDDDSEYKDFSLYVSGHSFGAAIANIVSFLIVSNGYNNDKMLTLSTFGSPRVGNIGWRNINRILGEERRLLHLRVSSDMDIIPSLPPKCLGFYHTGLNLNFKSHFDFVVSKSDLSRFMIPPSLSAKHHILAAYWEHIVIVRNRLELKKIVDIYDDMNFFGDCASTALSCIHCFQ